MDTLEGTNTNDISLKEQIYICHENFLSKVSVSPKILIQIINCISFITAEKVNKQVDKDEYNIVEHLKFLIYTIDKSKALPCKKK